jgi:hypothetical protein
MAKCMSLRLRSAGVWFAIPLVMGLAMAARYGLIEPAEIAHSCDGGAGTWLCLVRRLVVLSFSHHVLGYAALTFGLLATLLRGRAMAAAAAMLGIAGLVLYEFVPSAAAFLLGVLVLVRPHASPGEGQHGSGEQQT